MRREITKSEMYRTVSLPVPIDAEHIEATYEHGILVLSLPKAAVALPRQVPVKVKELTRA